MVFGAHIWARIIWSSRVSLERSCKMQFRRVDLVSIRPPSQKLCPNLIFARFPHFNYNTNYPRCRVTGWTCFFVNFSVLLWFGNYRNNSRWFWQLFNFLNHTSVSGIRPNLYFRVTLPNWMNFWKKSKRPSTPTNFRKIILQIPFRKRPKKAPPPLPLRMFPKIHPIW